MCGIAGIISLNPGLVSRQQLQKMTDALAHRGPEGEGFWFNAANTAGFGHRRLSIIDLSPAAAQPMHYHNRYTIVYNGELYNYPELKEELKSKGFQFYTQSDTEVILAAFACWDKECLQYFDGMFAFAIWDDQLKKLFAARDRFGEKPFYYIQQEDGGSIWFASEMKALYAGGFNRNYNEKMLLLFITNGITDSATDPSITFDNRISQLPPASYLEFQCSGSQSHISIQQYWDIDKEKETLTSDEEALETFRRLLSSSVEKRFRSDVPVGTSLSGGLDSSSIAAIASRISAGSNSYKCFSAVFPGFGKDESRFSQMVAQQFGLEQFVTCPNADGLATELQKFLYHQDEPVGSASVYAQYKVYQLAKQQGVSVLLDGQGADEMLAGYSKYLHWYLQELMKRKPGILKATIRELRSKNAELTWGWKNYLAAIFPLQAANRLEKRVTTRITSNTDITSDFKEANFESSLIYKPVVTKLNDILYYNTLQSGLLELLRYADRNSMAHSCEVRLPFLSHELAEFSFSLPASYKIRDGYSKWILRKSMSRQLPQEIVWRTDKIGFEPPQKEWMENRRVQEMIRASKEKLVQRRVLKQSVLNKKIQPQDSHAADNVDWWYLSAGLLPD
ncbi:MAG TPA: asparagine synthase (glutamine-hydrolyzing) [Chitinophagaceae bacterium]